MDAAEELRAARARAGLSLQQAAQGTRIPPRYLEALERGDTSVFPPGPFLSGYTRQYRKYLGLPEVYVPLQSAPSRPVAPPPTPPRRASPGGAADLDERTVTVTAPSILRQSRGRLAVLGAAVVVTAGLAVAVVARALPDAEPIVGEAPDQVVVLSVTEPVRARVVGDEGRVLFAGVLTPGENTRYAAHDRLELDLGSLDAVRIQYNGSTLKPLGAQSRPRRLVFVDDR